MQEFEQITDFEIKKLLSHLSFQKQIDNAKALLIQSEHDFGRISAIYACQLLDNLTCCEGNNNGN